MKKRSPVPSHYDAGAKACPICFLMTYNARRVCLECDYEFYKKKEPKK